MNAPLIFLFHVLLPLGIGSSLYILFRVETLLVFSWIDAFGLTPFVREARVAVQGVAHLLPEWLLYHAPGGLWVHAASAAMLLVWRGSADPMRWAWIGAPLGLAVAGEFGQRWSVAPGTYDVWDLVAYLLGFGLALGFIPPRPLRSHGSATCGGKHPRDLRPPGLCQPGHRFREAGIPAPAECPDSSLGNPSSRDQPEP